MECYLNPAQSGAAPNEGIRIRPKSRQASRTKVRVSRRTIAKRENSEEKHGCDVNRFPARFHSCGSKCTKQQQQQTKANNDKERTDDLKKDTNKQSKAKKFSRC